MSGTMRRPKDGDRPGNGSNRYYSGPVSDHFDGSLFFNPEGTPPGDIGKLLRWRLGNRPAKWPALLPSPFHGARPGPAPADGAIRATLIGHATHLVQAGGLNIITDPVYSDRASPLAFAGPKRINPPGIAFEDLPPIDVVLISHNHYDHLDLRTVKALVARDNPLIVTPLGNDAIILPSVPSARIETRDWYQAVEIKGADGVRAVIHFEPCHHWSARGVRDRRMALWAAFVIETAAHRVYHVGDTGFHGGRNFRDAAMRHGGFDLAILPIGAYEPRWFMAPQHMNPEEAVEGMMLARASAAIGHHWGTFQLTNEPVLEPEEKLFEARLARGLKEGDFLAMRPGQSWSIRNGTGRDGIS